MLIAVVLGAWLVLSVPVALVVGRVIRLTAGLEPSATLDVGIAQPHRVPAPPLVDIAVR